MPHGIIVAVRSPATPHELGAVDRGLGEFNEQHEALNDVRALHIIASDESGSTVGGAVGRTWGKCCELQQLWVNPARRHGTVGAVARDIHGNLAAATSTGGTTAKRYGRLGDVPVIGAGTWADGECAVSATGDGEYFIRAAAARAICARISLAGAAPHEAAATVLGEIRDLGGLGGVIVLDAGGRFSLLFSTEGMYRGHADRHGRRVAIFAEE